MSSVKDKRVSDFRTICEVHREIYEVITKEKLTKYDVQAIVELLEEAYKLGKKMDKKLREYKYGYDDDGFYEPNTNIDEKLKDRGINSEEFWKKYNKRRQKNEGSV